MIQEFLGINIGTLNQVMEVQECQTKTDESGFRVENWTTFKKIRGTTAYYPRYLRELAQLEGETTTQYKIFTCRYFEGLKTDHRILFRGSTYEVVGFDNMQEMNRFYQIYAREICL